MSHALVEEGLDSMVGLGGTGTTFCRKIQWKGELQSTFKHFDA